MLKVHVPQTSQNSQSHLPNITMKPLPLLSATTTSPCLMLVNWLTISPPKLVRTILLYPCYIPSTSHININSQETYEAASPAQCSHNLTLLDAGQLAYQVSSKTCVNQPTISILHFEYFPHPHKPSGGYSSKLSAADTHHIQQ